MTIDPRHVMLLGDIMTSKVSNEKRWFMTQCNVNLWC